MVSVKQHRLLSVGMQRLGQSIPQGPILPTLPTATGVTPENRWDCLESEWKQWESLEWVEVFVTQQIMVRLKHIWIQCWHQTFVDFQEAKSGPQTQHVPSPSPDTALYPALGGCIGTWRLLGVTLHEAKPQRKPWSRGSACSTTSATSYITKSFLFIYLLVTID